jgi:hypothetical protein
MCRYMAAGTVYSLAVERGYQIWTGGRVRSVVDHLSSVSTAARRDSSLIRTPARASSPPPLRPAGVSSAPVGFGGTEHGREAVKT